MSRLHNMTIPVRLSHTLLDPMSEVSKSEEFKTISQSAITLLSYVGQ